jgi:hypothetical protein
MAAILNQSGGNTDGGSSDGDDSGSTDGGNTDGDNSDGGSTVDGGNGGQDPIVFDPNANPFEGRTLYVNPTYQANLDTAIASSTGTTKTNLEQMRETPSAYWISNKATLTGAGTGSLEGILADAA